MHTPPCATYIGSGVLIESDSLWELDRPHSRGRRAAGRTAHTPARPAIPLPSPTTRSATPKTRAAARRNGSFLTAYSAAVRLSAKSLADDAIGSRTALGRAEAAARRAARVGVPSGIRLSSCAHCSTA